jgi:hypothetical protein
MDRTAVVISGDEVFQVDQDHLAAGHGDIAVRGETADAIVNRRRARGVIEIDELVRREVRIESDPEKPPLAR